MRIDWGTMFELRFSRALILSIPLGAVIVGLLWVAFWSVPPPPTSADETNGKVQTKPDHQEFTVVLDGNALTEKGFRVSMHLYKSSDGTKVTLATEDRNSNQEAIIEFTRRIRSSRKILERGTKYDEYGRPVGQRAVVLEADESESTHVILWVERAYVRSIASSSLRHALHLEKWLERKQVQ